MSALASVHTRESNLDPFEGDLRRTFFLPSTLEKATSLNIDSRDSKLAVIRLSNLVVEHNLCHDREPTTLTQVAFFKKSKVTEPAHSGDYVEGPLIDEKIKKIRLELRITEWKRLLPDEIANDKVGDNFVEPITGDVFSPQEALSTKYVYIGRYIFLVSSVVRRILTDSRNYIEGIYHPIENRPLFECETGQLKEQLDVILAPKFSHYLFLEPPIKFKNAYLLPPDILTSRIKVALMFREKMSERLLMTLNIGGWIEKSSPLPTRVTFPPTSLEGQELTIQSVLSFNCFFCLYIGRITTENNQLDPKYTEDNIKGFYARELKDDFQLNIQLHGQQQT